MQEAHRKGYEAIKAARPSLPVGLTLTTQDIQAVGPESLAETYRQRLYGDWVEVARSHADFFGVQTYTRFRVDAAGLRRAAAGRRADTVGLRILSAGAGRHDPLGACGDRQADLRHRKRNRDAG